MPITHEFRRTFFTIGGTMGALFCTIIALSFVGWRTQATTAFATLTVTNTNDNGAGSLRAAITASNASVGTLDTIDFALGAGTPTINLLSGLPTITDPVIINGNTGGSTRVELNGAGAAGVVSGLTITAGNSTIAGLVINRFGNHGIHILTNGGNTIKNCYLGTDANGTAVRGNTFDGVAIEGPPNNTIGGTTAAERNVISGNNRHGVFILVATATGNKVTGNYIGTDATGTADLGNTLDGVVIQDVSSNTIGGTTAGERNVISGNDRYGVHVLGATPTGNKVIGNFIGTDANGTADLGNALEGVYIESVNNTVGGTTAGERNVISGNDRNGVVFIGTAASGNKVSGNYIGTDVNGTADLGNTFDGAQSVGAPNNVFGGTTAGERNVISGNNRYGVVIFSPEATGNKVIGNYIGTDANGTADLGNGLDGVSLQSANNTVGGMTAGERNVISGNDRIGVVFFGTAATGNKVIGNYIGTDANGTADLGNTLDGVFFSASPNNTLGGTTAAERNLISGNDSDGVVVTAAATGNAILGNSIFNNSGLGIDLGNNGVTANDALDGDTGENNLQNFPVLTCATSVGGSTTIGGTLNSLPTAEFRIEFFVNDACDASGNGEGRIFLGFQNVMTDASGNATINATFASVIAPGRFITATASLLNGTKAPVETSEFSACRVVVVPTTANAGPDQKLILPTPSATLAANAPGGGIGAWSVVSGPSTLLSQFSSVTNPAATFTPAGGSGFYILRWTISHSPCLADSTDEVILSFAAPPTIAKAFAPATIVTGGTSTVTLTLNNSANPVGLVAAFTDTLTNMTAVGGGIGGTCAAVSSINIPANATALSFSGIALPPSSTCTVTFPVRSTVAGVHPNTTSGVTTDFTLTAGAPSNTANLTVNNPPPVTIAKAFSPATITAGGTSTVTLSLSNASNPIAVVASFTDTLTNMTAVGGPIGGSCASLSSIVLAANATSLSFSGILLPANSACTVNFAVRSNVVGVHPNTTSGVTTDQSPTAGAPSNTANLTVNAPTTQTIAKAFNPTTIVSGGTSTVTLTLSNTLTFGVLGSFTDALTNMTAVGGPIGTNCATLSTITLAANATNLNFSGIVIPGSGSCTVSFAVRSTVVGVHPNTTSGMTTDQSPVAGPVSNTANLTVTSAPVKTLASKAVRNDFNGDGKSDPARWHSDLGEWQVVFSGKRSSEGSSNNELHHIQLVEPNDPNQNQKDEYVAVAADFDGDKRTDAGVWRKSDGRWLIKSSSSGELMKAQFGLAATGLPSAAPLAADAVALRLRDQPDDPFIRREQRFERRLGEGAGPHHDDSHNAAHTRNNHWISRSPSA